MAANWASINEDKLPKVDKRGYYLKIEEMEKEGFIDGDVTNPKTGEAMQGCVGIIYNEEKNAMTINIMMIVKILSNQFYRI